MDKRSLKSEKTKLALDKNKKSTLQMQCTLEYIGLLI